MALGIRADDADAQLGVGVEGVREHNLAGLEAARVDNVSLGGQSQPDGLLVQRGLVVGAGSQQVLLVGLFCLLLGSLLHMRQERFRSLERLVRVDELQSSIGRAERHLLGGSGRHCGKSREQLLNILTTFFLPFN